MNTHQEHRFAQYVRTLGKGKKGSRSLSLEEARDAMSMILQGQVEDVQLGAFLMLLRVKEESAEEIAGFVLASRDHIRSQPADAIAVDIDWSSYAGKRRQPHWFLLSALLLAQQGYRIFMHGSRGHTEGRVYTQDILEAMAIPVAKSWSDVAQHIQARQFAFMSIETLCLPLHHLIQLRPLFGLRSPIHTLCRLLNPMSASTTLQSVFHPAYANTHHRAAEILGEQNASVFKGDAGEVEYRPHARVNIKTLRRGVSSELIIPRQCEAPEAIETNSLALQDYWEGKNKNDYAEQAILGTTAIALWVSGQYNNFTDAYEQASQFWQNRSALNSFTQ